MYGMANGVDVEWVRAAKPGEPSKPAEDLEAELRELRDEVRRLREQVAALAVESARPAPGDERLPTYVGRLDRSLEGGVPKGSVIAITGPGGSMKTSLALYILIKNRAAGRRGVYVTVEERRTSIPRGAASPTTCRSSRTASSNSGLAAREREGSNCYSDARRCATRTILATTSSSCTTKGSRRNRTKPRSRPAGVDGRDSEGAFDLRPVDLDPGGSRHQDVLPHDGHVPAAVSDRALQFRRDPLEREIVAREARVVDQQDVPVVHVGRQVGDVLVAVDLPDLDQAFDGLTQRPAIALEVQLPEVDVRIRLSALGQSSEWLFDEGHATSLLRRPIADTTNLKVSRKNVRRFRNEP